MLMSRRRFLIAAATTAVATQAGCAGAALSATASTANGLSAARAGEDLFAYLNRTQGGFEIGRYRAILGAANPFKEGDLAQGVASPTRPSW